LGGEGSKREQGDDREGFHAGEEGDSGKRPQYETGKAPKP
jgi:hypothetical protein